MAQIKDKAKQIQKLKSMGQYGSSVPSSGKRSAFVNLQRQKFFGDRDVPEERVLRRTRQEGGVRQFKDALIRNNRVVTGTRPDGSTYTVMNPNTGEPVYLTDVPGGRSVGDVSRDFAYRFGPTPREVLGDIGYGVSQFGSALGQKVMAGEFGLMGIAKGLYEQFTNSAAKAKDALVKGVNKLSDIDLEVLKKKDTGEYKFLSKKPEIQEIDALEQEEKGAIGLANEAGKTLDLAPLNATQRATYDMLTSKVNPLTHEQALNQVQSQFIDNRPLQEKLQDISKNNIRTQNGQSSAITDQQMNDAINKSNEIFGDDSILDDSQVNLQDIYMQGTKRYEPISVSGTQPMYAGGLDSLLPQPIQNLQQRISSLGETPIGTFGLENITSGKPAFTYEKDIFGGQLGLKVDPFRDQYGLEFSRSFKDGGSVDDKLDNMQKKTNNIYGTGILSAR